EALDQELSRRDGASHLSLLVQRNLAQRKHTPPTRPTLRAGSAEPAGFFEGASCPCEKRRTSMCGALRVLSAGSAATEGPRGSRSRSRARSTSNAKAKAAALGHGAVCEGLCVQLALTGTRCIVYM